MCRPARAARTTDDRCHRSESARPDTNGGFLAGESWAGAAFAGSISRRLASNVAQSPWPASRPDIRVTLPYQRHGPRPNINGQFAVAWLAASARYQPGWAAGFVATNQSTHLAF